jgi:hypothetical protein
MRGVLTGTNCALLMDDTWQLLFICFLAIGSPRDQVRYPKGSAKQPAVAFLPGLLYRVFVSKQVAVAGGQDLLPEPREQAVSVHCVGGANPARVLRRATKEGKIFFLATRGCRRDQVHGRGRK